VLGQQIGDERGKVTGRRVLPSDGQGPKMEVTFEARGQFDGIASVNVGTYWTVQTNGLLYGEGEGFITTNQGNIVQWTGSGAAASHSMSLLVAVETPAAVLAAGHLELALPRKHGDRTADPA